MHIVLALVDRPCSLGQFEEALSEFLLVLQLFTTKLTSICSLDEFEDALGFFKVPQPAPPPQHALAGPALSSGSSGGGSGVSGVQAAAQRSFKSFTSGQLCGCGAAFCLGPVGQGAARLGCEHAWRQQFRIGSVGGMQEVATCGVDAAPASDPDRKRLPNLRQTAWVLPYHGGPPFLPPCHAGATWVKASVGGMLSSLKPQQAQQQSSPRGGQPPGDGAAPMAAGAAAGGGGGFSGVERSVGSGGGAPPQLTSLDDRQGQPVKVQVSALLGCSLVHCWLVHQAMCAPRQTAGILSGDQRSLPSGSLSLAGLATVGWPALILRAAVSYFQKIAFILQVYRKSYKEFTDLRLVQQLGGHSGVVWALKFSRNGRFLASGNFCCGMLLSGGLLWWCWLSNFGQRPLPGVRWVVDLHSC